MQTQNTRQSPKSFVLPADKHNRNTQSLNNIHSSTYNIIQDGSERSLYSASNFQNTNDKVPYNRYLNSLNQSNTPLNMRMQKVFKKPKEDNYLAKDFDRFSTEYKQKIANDDGQKQIQSWKRKFLAQEFSNLPYKGSFRELKELGIFTPQEINTKNNADKDVIQEQNEDSQISRILENLDDLLDDKAKQDQEVLTLEQQEEKAKEIEEQAAKITNIGDLKEFVKENDDYFQHLKGNCLCVNDKCGLCKCRFFRIKLRPDYFSNQKSRYGQEFYSKSASKNTVDSFKMTQNLPFTGIQVQAKSVMKCDYTEPDQPLKVPKKKHPQAHPMFCGSSVYKRQFLEWGALPKDLMKNSQPISSFKDLPMAKKTSYNNDYHKYSKSQIPEIQGNNWRTTLVKNLIPFQKETTQNIFQSYHDEVSKNERIEADKITRNQLDVSDNRSFIGAFKTVSQREFKRNSTLCLSLEDKFRGSYNESIYKNVKRKPNLKVNFRAIEPSVK